MNFFNFWFNNNSQNSQINNSNQNQNNFNNNNNQNQMTENINDFQNLNINDTLGNSANINSRKLYNIKESKSCIYIENINQICTIKIPKSFEKIYLVDNENELINFFPDNISQADAIIGIFDLKNNKYLAVVTSSIHVANINGSDLYNIISVEFIKITNNNESINDSNLIKNIKSLFSTRNFYYSNNYDISLSLYNQSKINNKSNSKYLMNISLIKYFIDNNIPEFFYSSVIFGYIECLHDININENIDYTIDIIIIERFFNKNIIINRNIPGYIKQVELISIFKNTNNKNLDKTFSYVCYMSSESFNSINKFLPVKDVIITDLKLYKNIICVLNNLSNKNITNIKMNEVMMKFNKNLLNDKIYFIDFTSDWDNNLYCDTVYDSKNYIDFYLNNSEEKIQQNIYWFIDINNISSNNDICFQALIRIMFKVIKKEIDYIGININIGSYEQNNNNIVYKKYNEIINKYQNDFYDMKKSLFNSNDSEKYQEIIDKFFCYNNLFEENIKNKDNIKSFKDNSNKDSNFQKLNILCTTWNVAGIPYRNYNIEDLFKKNIFYKERKSPDIIIVAMQEIVELNFSNILFVSNQEAVDNWTNNIISTVQKIFQDELYILSKCLNLVGIYILVLIKSSLSKKIFLLDHNTTKTGVYGTLGNKGFFTITFQIFDKILSIGSGHFEAGKGKNDTRIMTLNQILNKSINIQEDEFITFKDADYWIILGDLNFRIDLSYEDAISCIQEKNYDVLYGMDQLNSSLNNNEFFKKNINEKKINFDPTYKYEKESNEYAYDEDKIRVPAWTDRILYSKKKGINMLNYDCIKSLRYSDHRPVVGAFEIYYTSNKKNMDKADVKYNKKHKNIDLIDDNSKNDNDTNKEKKNDFNSMQIHKSKSYTVSMNDQNPNIFRGNSSNIDYNEGKFNRNNFLNNDAQDINQFFSRNKNDNSQNNNLLKFSNDNININNNDINNNMISNNNCSNNQGIMSNFPVNFNNQNGNNNNFNNQNMNNYNNFNNQNNNFNNFNRQSCINFNNMNNNFNNQNINNNNFNNNQNMINDFNNNQNNNNFRNSVNYSFNNQNNI